MTRKPQTTAFWRGRLPHWEVEGGRYFVTLHLAGAIPVPGQERIRELAEALDRFQHVPDKQLQLQRRVFAEMERWLDRAERVQHLSQPPVAQMVCDAITHRQASVWDMIEYVVMPNHLHLFFELRQPGLKDTLDRFKRWTGHEAGKVIDVNGRFWQDEWFDHWSRSDSEDDRIADYIRRNPVVAGLVERYQDWPFGSWAVQK